jgi:Secretion system C-terminal sorting domain
MAKTKLFQKAILLAFLTTCITSNLLAQWYIPYTPSPWGNIYGVGYPTNRAGVLCNGNDAILFKYDASGNRILRTVDFLLIKTKKDGKDDSVIADAVEKYTEEEVLNSTEIQVFPNPTTDAIVVQQSQVANGTTVELYDSKGQQVSKQSANTRTILDVADQPAGFYLLVVRSGKATAQWKIIKN